MTAEQLNKMQEEARKRHPAAEPIVEIVEKKEKSLSEVLSENFDLVDGELKLKKSKRGRKPKEKIILPDLMAAQIPVSCTSDKTTEPEVMKREYAEDTSIFDRPHVPKPVQEKRAYHKQVVVSEEPPPQKWERHKAVYTNMPSPFGIASELLAEQLKEGR